MEISEPVGFRRASSVSERYGAIKLSSVFLATVRLPDARTTYLVKPNVSNIQAGSGKFAAVLAISPAASVRPFAVTLGAPSRMITSTPGSSAILFAVSVPPRTVSVPPVPGARARITAASCTMPPPRAKSLPPSVKVLPPSVKLPPLPALNAPLALIQPPPPTSSTAGKTLSPTTCPRSKSDSAFSVILPPFITTGPVAPPAPRAPATAGKSFTHRPRVDSVLSAFTTKGPTSAEFVFRSSKVRVCNVMAPPGALIFDPTFTPIPVIDTDPPAGKLRSTPRGTSILPLRSSVRRLNPPSVIKFVDKTRGCSCGNTSSDVRGAVSTALACSTTS